MSLDLNAVLHEGVFGFMPTMIRDELDIVYIDRLLEQLEHDNGAIFEKEVFCGINVSKDLKTKSKLEKIFIF